ncbi:hypothetical protein C0992_000284, partial [Termitomyces sp. T32_za158]
MPADTDHSSTHAQRGFAPKRIKSVVRNRRKKTITPWSCIVSGLRHAASQGVASIVSIPVLVTALCLTKHPQEASEVQTQIQSLHSGDDLLERRFNDDERYLLAEELESKNKDCETLRDQLRNERAQLAAVTAERDYLTP